VKNLIKITAPENYIHHGITVWLNPDEVCTIFRESEATVIRLKNGDLVYSNWVLDAVVKTINENAGH
jgi:hypothetical protein